MFKVHFLTIPIFLRDFFFEFVINFIYLYVSNSIHLFRDKSIILSLTN